MTKKITTTNEDRRAELLSDINLMIEKLSDLPREAMSKPITHYDYHTLLSIIAEVVRSV
jgi:hypothetical protein